jgi:hypothetical protein
MNKPPARITERILPPNFKNIIQSEFRLRFTFVERIKILIGYNVKLDYLAYTVNSPGSCDQKMKHEVVGEF